VCHHDAGASRHQFGDCPLDLRLRLGVHGTGRLVQDQDAGIERQGPCKTQQLTLTDAE
jgi:hypothetical protein